MIILGIGSNLGHRLQNLRNAFNLLKQPADIQVLAVSPVYQSEALVPEHAPANWNKPFYNVAIGIQTPLTPLDLLKRLKTLEKKLGRIIADHWAPRVIDLDILAWDQQIYDETHLKIPHAGLLERPFALWPLLDIMPSWQHPTHYSLQLQREQQWGERYSIKAPFKTQQILHRIDAPQLVGIVNASPESFTADSFQNTDELIAHSIALWEAGASVLDFGGQSTAPGAKILSPEYVWKRLEPIFTALNAYWQNNPERPLFSIDSHQPFVVEKAFEHGVDWINDISGYVDSTIQTLVKNSKVRCVLMHQLVIPADPKHNIPLDADPIDVVCLWFKNRMNTLDIDSGRFILDPGIGFAKNLQQKRRLLQNLSAIQSLGCDLMVGHSRKVVGLMTKPWANNERDIETVSVGLSIAAQTDYLRVHNVAWMQQALCSYLHLLTGIHHESFSTL